MNVIRSKIKFSGILVHELRNRVELHEVGEGKERALIVLEGTNSDWHLSIGDVDGAAVVFPLLAREAVGRLVLGFGFEPLEIRAASFSHLCLGEAVGLQIGFFRISGVATAIIDMELVGRSAVAAWLQHLARAAK